MLQTEDYEREFRALPDRLNQVNSCQERSPSISSNRAACLVGLCSCGVWNGTPQDAIRSQGGFCNSRMSCSKQDSWAVWPSIPVQTGSEQVSGEVMLPDCGSSSTVLVLNAIAKMLIHTLKIHLQGRYFKYKEPPTVCGMHLYAGYIPNVTFHALWTSI